METLTTLYLMINRLFSTLLFLSCLFCGLSPTAKAQNNEWENPTQYEWNKEKPHADFRLYERADDAVNDASDERATGGRGCGGNQQPGSCADAVLRLWDLGSLQCTICIF